ncbi:hypothetical protein BJ508DRAFT_309655 [Ascobolus immersus RN42]|uniref:Uncharacterized protein n=1 Tax=Ascobolus immersus RN42 TaxID=1160509 RepID=A0A3N4HXY9_ASCIM|nr:hypothetical protein BJ508DRAFT_309655 [Ascobolus immersus RN42]
MAPIRLRQNRELSSSGEDEYVEPGYAVDEEEIFGTGEALEGGDDISEIAYDDDADVSENDDFRESSEDEMDNCERTAGQLGDGETKDMSPLWDSDGDDERVQKRRIKYGDSPTSKRTRTVDPMSAQSPSNTGITSHVPTQATWIRCKKKSNDTARTHSISGIRSHLRNVTTSPGPASYNPRRLPPSAPMRPNFKATVEDGIDEYSDDLLYNQHSSEPVSGALMEEIQSYQHPPPASQPSECVDHPPEDGTIHTPPDAIQKDPPLVDSATDSMDPRERPDRTPNVPHGSSLPCDSTDTTFNYNPNNQPLDTVCDSDEDLIEQCALLIDEAMADELLSNALSHMAPEEGSDDEGMDEENVRAWSKYRHLRSSLSLAARDTTRLDTESVADILADTHGASDIRMGRPEQTDGDDIRQNTRQLTTDDIEELRAMVGNAWAMTEDERAASKHWRRATNADFSGKSRAQTPREIKRRRKRHRSPRPLDSPLRLSSSPSDPDDSPLSSSSSSSDEDGTTVDHKNPRGNCTKSDLATIAYHDIRIRSKIPREGDNIYMRLFQRIADTPSYAEGSRTWHRRERPPGGTPCLWQRRGTLGS